jgi:hypothetical protein
MPKTRGLTDRQKEILDLVWETLKSEAELNVSVGKFQWRGQIKKKMDSIGIRGRDYSFAFKHLEGNCIVKEATGSGGKDGVVHDTVYTLYNPPSVMPIYRIPADSRSKGLTDAGDYARLKQRMDDFSRLQGGVSSPELVKDFSIELAKIRKEFDAKLNERDRRIQDLEDRLGQSGQ